MNERTSTRFKAVTSARIRAVLSLGIVLGLTSVSTLAYWTDEAQMTTGTIQAGSLDMLINNNLPGQGGTWANSAMTASNMIPGDSFAFTVPIQRAPNTAAFAVTATGTASGELAPHLRWSIHEGTAGTSTTNTATGIRSNTCSGTQLSSNVALSGTAATLIPAANAVNLGGTTFSKNLCIRVSMPTDTGNAAQSKSGTAAVNFTATQLQ